jgi:hypothetical protein
MGRVTKALSNFLEEDFSPAHIGLSSGARAHLERFRSFLHTYYVEKFGYWPPPKGSVFSKSLCKSMYFDFRSLYDFLVDLSSTDSLQDQKPASGGVCVLQNVQAFDLRHKYIPLPHPNPLLPEFSSDPHRSNSQRSLLNFKLATRQAKTERYISNRDALFAATNSTDSTVVNSPLVKAYRRFERQCTLRPEEKISMSDGRKVRWMLIYGIIQMLVSVIRAPKEVRDVDTPTYPLCCLVATTLPWNGGARALNDYYTESANLAPPISPSSIRGSLEDSLSATPIPTSPQVSIQPDCETSDFFSHTSLSSNRPTSKRGSGSMEPPPIRRRSTLFRNASFRSVKAMSFSSFGSGSSSGGRRNSVVVKPPVPKFSEILIHGYGNGLNQTTLDSRAVTPSEMSAEILPEIVVSEQSPPQSSVPQKRPSLRDNINRRTAPGRLITPSKTLSAEPSRTPILDSFDVDKIHDPPALEDLDSPSDNTNSAPLTPIWSRSTSPSSTESIDLDSRVERHASVNTNFSTNSTLISSPVVVPKRSSSTASGITANRTLSVDSSVTEDISFLDPMDNEAAYCMNGEEVEVYQPSGGPLVKRDSLPSRTGTAPSERDSLTSQSSVLRERDSSVTQGTLRKRDSAYSHSGAPLMKRNSLPSQASAPVTIIQALPSQKSASLTTRQSLPSQKGPSLTTRQSLPSQSGDLLNTRHSLSSQTSSRLQHRDTFPLQPNSPLMKRESLSSQALRRQSVPTNLKGSLKRSDAVANKHKRRSVRILEEVDLFDVIRMSPSAVA